ncbi:MAG: TolC family outer membrane protein [Magnetococcales bacterium]|nr:TolC family outer membrane protein [Magnetococcales bacterium]
MQRSWWPVGKGIRLLALLLLCQTAQANEEPFLHAVHTALERNPQIIAAQANLAAARERLPQSRAALLPTVAANLTPSRQVNRWDKGDTTQQTVIAGLSLSQILYNRPALIAYEQTAPWIAAYADDLDGMVQTIFFKVVQAAVNGLQAREIVQLAENNFALMQRHLKDTESRYRVGEITRTSVSQAEARRATALSDLTRAKNDLAVAKAGYFEVVGMPMPDNLALPTLPRSPDEGRLESWLAQLEQRPDLRAASKRLNIAELSVQQEDAGHWPTLSLTSSVNHTWQRSSIDQMEGYTLGMKMELPLFSGGMTLSRTAEAQAKRDAQQAEVDRLRRQAYREIEKAKLDLSSTQALALSLQSSVEASRLARDGVEREYRVGTRPALDLLDAEHELFSYLTDQAKNRYALQLARFQMLLAVGRLTLEELVIPAASGP